MDNSKIVETKKVAPASAIRLGKKHRGIESLKSTYGRMFVLHWEIGLLLFFVVPLIKSLYFAFCDLSFSEAGGTVAEFVGLSNINYAINEDPQFMDFLTTTLGAAIGSLPVIVILSLILALLLNQKFRGRLFFRALYFLPVIIASGIVITHLFSSTSSELSSSGVSDSFASNMITADDILSWISLPPSIIDGFSSVLNNIFNLVWNCGIQIVLFISGMQSIPDSLYEVSKVEGATKWEEFWFITLPMLSRTLILVIIFTMVELVTDKNNDVMSLSYRLMTNGFQNYGKASAMLWIYFAIVSAGMALIILIYNALFLKRWDTGGRS